MLYYLVSCTEGLLGNVYRICCGLLQGLPDVKEGRVSVRATSLQFAQFPDIYANGACMRYNERL
jgi:hypothetical protein